MKFFTWDHTSGMHFITADRGVVYEVSYLTGEIKRKRQVFALILADHRFCMIYDDTGLPATDLHILGGIAFVMAPIYENNCVRTFREHLVAFEQTQWTGRATFMDVLCAILGFVADICLYRIITSQNSYDHHQHRP